MEDVFFLLWLDSSNGTVIGGWKTPVSTIDAAAGGDITAILGALWFDSSTISTIGAIRSKEDSEDETYGKEVEDENNELRKLLEEAQKKLELMENKAEVLEFKLQDKT